MLKKSVLELLETNSMKLISYTEQSDEETYGPYGFEIDTEAQTYYAFYTLRRKANFIYLDVDHDILPIIALKKVYNMLFKMKRMVEKEVETTGYLITIEEPLLEKIETLKRTLGD